MHKQIVTGLIILGGLGVVAGGLEAKAPPKKIVISACKKKMSAVHLNHEAHVKERKIACKTCHHKGSKSKPCATCHGGKAVGRKKLGCEEMSPKKNPYHVLCIGCHKKQGKGARTCKACHK
jgi:hypothetical protein